MTGRNLFTDAAAQDGERASEARNLAAFDATMVPNLTDCSRFECVVSLYEHETAETDFVSWPQDVQLMMHKHVTAWRDRNSGARIVAITTAIVDRCAIMIVHHRKA